MARRASRRRPLALLAVLLAVAVALTSPTGRAGASCSPTARPCVALVAPARVGFPRCCCAPRCAGVTSLIGGRRRRRPSSANARARSAIGLLMVLMRDLRMRNQELSEARAELARLAVAEERERFARDLHDLLGHSAVGDRAQGRAGRPAAGRPARARPPPRSPTSSRSPATALGEVREAVSGYRQPTLERRARRRADGAVGGRHRGRRRASRAWRWTPTVEAVLAWAVREGATNVIRHSGARPLHDDGSRPGLADAGVEVVDDGGGPAGARGEAAAVDRPRHGGHGLAGLQRARAAAARPDRGRAPA